MFNSLIQTKEAGTQAAFESESESEEEEGIRVTPEKEPMHIEVIIPEANLAEAAEVIYSADKSNSGTDGIVLTLAPLNICSIMNII